MPMPRSVTAADTRRWRGSVRLFARLTANREDAARLRHVANNPCLLARGVFPLLWLEEQLSALGCGEGESRRRRHALLVQSMGHPDPWQVATALLDDFRAARANATKASAYDA